MAPTFGTGKQSFRLFRLAGIDVSIHWSWFLVAFYEITMRKSRYHSPVWNVAEYLTLFGIVLLHEFGHALACRQTGGKSDHITLWPLGGIAFVQPPNRAGALLWSITAGPLVNVVLLPITGIFYYGVLHLGWGMGMPDLQRYIVMVAILNVVLLAFNLLPIYPLDGGQILRAILWFMLGPARSLMVACVVGMLGGLALIAGAFQLQSIWIGLIAVFGIQRCWLSFKYARALAAQEKWPRHHQFACPECSESPYQGDKWICACGARFDPFVNQTICPNCQKHEDKVQCPACRKTSEFSRWLPA